MGIVDRVMEAFGYQKSVGPLLDDHRIHRSLRVLSEGSNTVASPYRQSVWVYACINTIAQNLQRVPFVLKEDAGDLEPSIIEDGELYELFLNPNPLMTLKTLIEATFVYFGLRGEAFWILEGRENVTQIPKEIWTFDPIRFEEVQDERTGMLKGWKYKGKSEYFFPSEHVIHFKMFNPYNDLRGLAPLEAARLSVDQDFQSSVFNKAFFENGATVGGFITIPAGTDLTDEQFDRLLKQFEGRHKGASKAYKIAVVEGGGQFTEAKLTQKDMDFIEGKKLTRQEILSAYKVNEVVLGVYTSLRSYEGIKAAHKAFWEECEVPKIEYFQEVLWAKLFSKIVPRKGKGKVWGEFDLANVGPLQVNYQEKIKTAMSMFHMGWPINDINKRLQLGMKEVPWGNQWWVPGGFLPVSSISTSPKKDSSDNNKDVSIVVRGNAPLSPLEVDFKAKLGKLLFEQRKRAIAEAFGKRNWKSVQLDKDYTKLKDSIYSIYTDAVHSGVFCVQRQQEIEELSPLTSYAVDISVYAEGRSSFVSKGFQQVVENVLSSLSKNGMSNDVLGDKVREIYNLLSSKASLVAKSEVENAFTFGKDLAAKQIRDALSPSLEFQKDEIKLLK